MQRTACDVVEYDDDDVMCCFQEMFIGDKEVSVTNVLSIYCGNIATFFFLLQSCCIWDVC